MYKVITRADGPVFLSSPIPNAASGQRDQANWKGGNVLLQLPFTIVEWTYIPSLEPTRDAMEMEGVL
jgi:hypothetical protein